MQRRYVGKYPIMKNILIFGSILFFNTAHAQIAIDHFESYEFIAPTPNIEIKARALIERHASNLLESPVLLPICGGVFFIEEPPKVKLSLQYIGSRETWIPITGKVKKENFYRVN